MNDVFGICYLYADDGMDKNKSVEMRDISKLCTQYTSEGVNKQTNESKLLQIFSHIPMSIID